MSQTSMPKVDTCSEGDWGGGGGGGGVQRIELVRTITTVKDHPSTGVLHRKTDIIKFNGNGILTSKTTNRDKVPLLGKSL